jgi:branched-subunit amino acid transport protein
MERNTFGWFGWLSAAGFAILTALFVLDIVADSLWAFSAFWTIVVAVIAGIGAVALYAGTDPTAETYDETTA